MTSGLIRPVHIGNLEHFLNTSGDAAGDARPALMSSAVWGQALSDYPPPQCRCRSRARASLRNRRQGPSSMGFEDEVEQSFSRPCRQSNSRTKRTHELTSSIVPRGTSFHCSVDLGFPPIELILWTPHAASLIGHLGSSTFRLSTTTVSMSLTGSCFSSESAPRPFQYGIRGRGGTIF